MKSIWRRWTDRLIRFGLNASGLAMLLSFPATWMAPVPGMLWVVLGMGIGGGCVHCALLWLEREPLEDGGPRPRKVVSEPAAVQPHRTWAVQDRAA